MQKAAGYECQPIESPTILNRNRQQVGHALIDLLGDAQDYGINMNDAIGVALSSVAWALQYVVTPGREQVLAEHLIGAMRLARAERAVIEEQVAGNA